MYASLWIVYRLLVTFVGLAILASLPVLSQVQLWWSAFMSSRGHQPPNQWAYTFLKLLVVVVCPLWLQLRTLLEKVMCNAPNLKK